MARDLRFNEGDLLMVRKDFIGGAWRGGTHGPLIVGASSMNGKLLNPGLVYLAVAPTRKATHRENYRLYIEVMTDDGPRLCWASAFEVMKKEGDDA